MPSAATPQPQTNTRKANVLLICAALLILWNIRLSTLFSSISLYQDDENLLDYLLPEIQSYSNVDEVKNRTGALLDFAVIGFPKCGTSTMMRFLHTKSSFVPGREICDFNTKNEEKIDNFQKLITELSRKNPGKKIGVKCPSSAESFRFYDNVKKFYGDDHTRYIVGIRHPIDWFESFYNFRVNNIKKGSQYPLPNQLIGMTCYKTRPLPSLCTARGRVSHYLAHMGKTPLTSPDELNLISNPSLVRRKDIKNPIFLYNLDQLRDNNQTRAEIFHQDITKFVGISFFGEESIEEKKSVPGKKWSEDEQARRDALKIDICDSKYDKLRQELLEEAIKSKQWILEYFLTSDEVYVSSKYYFEKTMERWSEDPCNTRSKR